MTPPIETALPPLEPTRPDGSLALDKPVELPDVLDALIVGAGPAGTAAAFRAKELKIPALVIEHDDVMKRIRDYDKRKPIKPDFGAGKEMGFPEGGALLAALRFDQISKDELHRRWRALYHRHSVPARIGVELLGLQHEGTLWQVSVRDHNREREEVLEARHVVLALGAGMPRALDIPGEVTAVATRMGAAERFVGAPACVIGGGTTAAEAVIAISNAKAAARDPHPVYWAHRGEKMPKVSEALAPELFSVVHGNGNLRYLPNSNPVAIVESDGRPVLQIDVDRTLPHRDPETDQLEFAASHCLACIGQELPTGLLGRLGVSAVVGGPRNRRGFALSPLLETTLPNVFMIGDTLNQSYLECGRFTEDPGTYGERAHRGNIKRALTDGVIVAEVLAQKLAGITDVQVSVVASAGVPDPIQSTPAAPARPPESAPPAEATLPGGPAPPPEAALVRLLEGEVEAEQFPLAAEGSITIGRDACDIVFEDDTALEPRHLSIVGRTREGKTEYLVRDDSSVGAFLRLTEAHPREIEPGAILKLGQQWLVFGTGAGARAFSHHDARGALVDRHELKSGTILVGRDAPDIVLSTTDTSLSRRHASIALKDAGTPRARVVVRDLHSVNGTYLKVSGLMPLRDGDEIRVGHQRLRFGPVARQTSTQIHFDATRRAEVLAPATGPSQPSTVPPAPSAPPLPEGLAVTFHDVARTCPLAAGQSICELAEAQGIVFSAECHQGICGSDPIRILAGLENLNLMSEDERSTLEELCALDPARYRLACLARPTGPVVVSFEKK